MCGSLPLLITFGALWGEAVSLDEDTSKLHNFEAGRVLIITDLPDAVNETIRILDGDDEYLVWVCEEAPSLAGVKAFGDSNHVGAEANLDGAELRVVATAPVRSHVGCDISIPGDVDQYRETEGARVSDVADDGVLMANNYFCEDEAAVNILNFKMKKRLRRYKKKKRCMGKSKHLTINCVCSRCGHVESVHKITSFQNVKKQNIKCGSVVANKNIVPKVIGSDKEVVVEFGPSSSRSSIPKAQKVVEGQGESDSALGLVSHVEESISWSDKGPVQVGLMGNHNGLVDMPLVDFELKSNHMEECNDSGEWVEDSLSGEQRGRCAAVPSLRISEGEKMRRLRLDGKKVRKRRLLSNLIRMKAPFIMMKAKKSRKKVDKRKSSGSSSKEASSVSDDAIENRNRLILLEAEKTLKLGAKLGLVIEGNEEEVISKLQDMEARDLEQVGFEAVGN